MPRETAHITAGPTSVPAVGATSTGQVIEYIQDRLYLGSYTHPPNAHTPFPYPQKQQARTPSKRSSRAQTGPTSTGPKVSPPVYFSIDKQLVYNAFHADFGPLHIGHLYRFAVTLHEVLADPANTDRGVVFWSGADSRSRANAACMLACYMVLIQNWPPHLALAPIAQMDPPCMPFRDAGYSQADYVLNIQDVVYGVWKAKENGLFSLKEFSLEEYELYERVDMGDFNWISPDFLAFASPQYAPVTTIPRNTADWDKLPKTANEVFRSKTIPAPFKNVLCHFEERNIGLVVRLNSQLYSSSYFEALGIQHLDMIFDDGTCPPLSLVRTFINLAREVIEVRKQGIAVHCKAGLGRTGCLIGAYLIFCHGFTANEVIAYMRFMRPGMVVGPQQHWLHLNQQKFREWWFEDQMKEKMAAIMPSTPTRLHSKQRLASNGQTFTPPNGNSKRSALGEIEINEQHAPTGVSDENLPAPTPGQPRKTSKIYGTSSRHRSPENEPFVRPDTEVVSVSRHIRGDSESEEEYQLRLIARRAPRSPVASDKRRAVSCTSTTTVTKTREWSTSLASAGAESDVENRASGRPKTPARNSNSGSGKGDISMSKLRSSPSRRSGEVKGAVSVRKTSGRVGSLGTVSTTAKKA
ncbi:phosphatases II [Venturia nashicola]|uniref:protein-tyrosine-phosphatase n=1 Tax=Venturia nashicola TaxID=86259 RepID=A0A4Z1NQJ7_9PEZI|nr:phosphatases II [Venturia nashicola]TLD27903.1 phosphatases II [Venturia nashicola]